MKDTPMIEVIKALGLVMSRSEPVPSRALVSSDNTLERDPRSKSGEEPKKK